ncbi:heparan-alpha-glucosaminide N-acetyltransferase domain-containing protein [uncultured Kocuria sp.]|uniref:heparan-alpha-glucosaminide N-acetyltransferase domain-containing protein n=1 Tax=uncultured Kocuria sp. TaxID=259305 RepID=UPI0026325BBC|nr:heparan-alpha-glucosaminide N-acetyltransferase domain-containing protein [uncultured Kocuria sp.]
MSRTSEAPTTGPTRTTDAAPARRPRLVAVDAARGLALIGMIAVHILPVHDPETFEPTLQWSLFGGRAAALFALLAGLSLAFSSGGRAPHRGRALTATRAGLVVRALLIASVGLAINQVMPSPAPALGILVYYGAFFLLAVPLLGLRRRTLAVAAAVCAVLGPVLVHVLGPALPQPAAVNPTLGSVLTDPGGTLAQVLLTGTYPAVPYLTYLCAGLLLGRTDLHEVVVRVRIAVVGVVLALGAWFVYWVLVLQAGGYDQLMRHTPWLSEDQIDEIIVWGPSPDLPTSTWWWLLTPGPHSNTPVTLLMDLGTGLAVLGLFLLLARPNRLWTTLGAMGGRTLSLYSAHLLALATAVHDDDRPLWFTVHVAVAAVLAVLWARTLGQGPLERGVAAAVRGTRRLVLGTPARAAESPRV